MPDITMCTNVECGYASECYRFSAWPDPQWQEWSRFDDPQSCFMPIPKHEDSAV